MYWQRATMSLHFIPLRNSTVFCHLKEQHIQWVTSAVTNHEANKKMCVPANTLTFQCCMWDISEHFVFFHLYSFQFGKSACSPLHWHLQCLPGEDVDTSPLSATFFFLPAKSFSGREVFFPPSSSQYKWLVQEKQQRDPSLASRLKTLLICLFEGMIQMEDSLPVIEPWVFVGGFFLF